MRSFRPVTIALLGIVVLLSFVGLAAPAVVHAQNLPAQNLLLDKTPSLAVPSPNLLKPITDRVAWQTQTHADARLDESVEGDTALVTLAKPGTLIWHAQLNQHISGLVEDHTYVLTVRLRADSFHPVRFNLTTSSDFSRQVGLNTTVNAGPEWQVFRAPFTARHVEGQDCILQLLFGATVGQLRIGEVNLTETPGSTDPLFQHAVKVTWNIDLQKVSGDGRSFVFPLPVNGFGQKVTYSVDGAERLEPVTSVVQNHLIRIFPNRGFVTVHVQVTRDAAGGATLSSYAPAQDGHYPPDVQPYLKVTAGLDQSTPSVSSVAAKLKGKDSLTTIKNVLSYVSHTIKYDYKYWRTVDEILANHVGQCEGQSAAAVALLRQLGIPTRMIFMVYPNKPKGNIVDGHTIIQFYLPGCGWMMGDPGSSDRIFPSVVMNYGEEPIPYYYCRQAGTGALIQPGESLAENYPVMWQYLKSPQNREELMVASTMSDFFKILYDCTVEQKMSDQSAAGSGQPPADRHL